MRFTGKASRSNEESRVKFAIQIVNKINTSRNANELVVTLKIADLHFNVNNTDLCTTNLNVTTNHVTYIDIEILTDVS